MNSRLLIFFLFISINSVAQKASEIIFAQVYHQKSWRIIDTNGSFILNQRYGVGSYTNLCFTEGVAITFNENKYGFADFNNKQIIPNKYDAVQCFEFGYASVAVGQKWGIINQDDKFIVQPEYDYAGSFGPEGLVGLIKDGKLAFADTTGRIVIPLKYYWISSFNNYPKYPIFNNGLIAIIDAGESNDIRNGKIGFMNTAGEIIIKPQYDIGNSGLPFFINGTATVFKNQKLILIDTLGNEILKPNLNSRSTLYFFDGFSTISDETGHEGMIDKNGTLILEPKYNAVSSFSEGYAAVQISGNENGVISGFVNKKGQFIFNKNFGFIRNFHEGYAAVEVNGSWGYIDTTGNFIIEPKYSSANDFNKGIAVVSIKKGKSFKYGFIDKTGKFIIEPIYNKASNFEFGLAPVKIGNKYGYINTKGKIVIKPKFENAQIFQMEQIGRSQ